MNPDLGRDHWPTCWSLALGGGGIKGGRVVGSSDETGARITSRATSMGDVFATIYKAFGIDWTKEYDTPIGRPIKIANSLEDTTGEPIAELASSLFGVGKAKSNEVHWVLGASRGMEARSQ